jgi:acyl carrier protein phosphodiesterase
VNYLAHLLLAEPGEEARLGALLGDFMRGQQLADLAPAVQEGVRLHREVDRFTDAHPVFLRSKARLDPRVRRFAGVIVDVFYDHFLASRWEAWCEQPLSEFAADVYGMLERRLPELPPRMQYVVPFMIQQDWLTSYRETRHVERALRGMSRRVKRENPLAASAAELEAHYPALGGDFDEFFPQLVTAHAGGRAMVRSQS